MTRLVIFDKDGVILDLQATWLPVARAVAAHTVTLIPAVGGVMADITTADLLHAIGVDDQRGYIDPKGIFATGSFAQMRAKWQVMLPPQMIDLEHDRAYSEAVQTIVHEQTRQTTKAKGDVVTPLHALYQHGYQLALVTNDSESSARQSLDDLGIVDLFCAIVGADSGFGSKPDPDGLLHCCDVARVTPDESIMVGDTNADYGAAMAAGCKAFVCIADAFEFRPHDDIQPEFVIAELMGLPELLGVGLSPSAAIGDWQVFWLKK